MLEPSNALSSLFGVLSFLVSLSLSTVFFCALCDAQPVIAYSAHIVHCQWENRMFCKFQGKPTEHPR